MFKQICRTCLQISQDMHLINKLSKDNNIIIEQMLLKVMPEFNKDELTPAPLEICEICLNKLKISYNFHLQCMEINKKLKKMLTTEDQSDNLVAEQDMKINESSEKEINEILNSIKQEDTAVANETVQYIVKEEYEIQEMDYDRPFPMEMQTEENESLDESCIEGLRFGQINEEETDTKQLQELNKNNGGLIETMQHCQKETNRRNISKCECEDTRKTVEELKGTIEQREKVISGQMKLLMEAHAEQKVLLNRLLRQKKDSLQIYDKFPVRSVENLIELDGEITTETKHVYVKAMNSILKPAGVQKNLKYIITNNVMMEFNIDGNQGKQSFKKLQNFYSTLLESIPITTDSGPAEEQLRKAIQLQKKREIKSKCLKNKK